MSVGDHDEDARIVDDATFRVIIGEKRSGRVGRVDDGELVSEVSRAMLRSTSTSRILLPKI